MRTTSLLLFMVFALSLAAQTDRSATKLDRNEASTMRQVQSTDKQHSPKDMQGGPGQLSSSDQSFLKALIEEDISEISLAKMAMQKSSNNDVKDYAQTKILNADPEMRDGATKIAAQYGMQPPTEPNGTERATHDQLSKKTGKEFDTAYMVYEATQQTDDVKLVNAELKSTTNAEVKSYVAREKKPVVDAASSAKEVSAKIASELRGERRPAVGKNERH